jgi:hypothetical protein
MVHTTISNAGAAGSWVGNSARKIEGNLPTTILRPRNPQYYKI